MVEAGKRQYLVEALIPDLPGYLRMDYSKAQYSWAEKNEPHVWAALIENRLLYSSDGQYFRCFLADGLIPWNSQRFPAAGSANGSGYRSFVLHAKKPGDHPADDDAGNDAQRSSPCRDTSLKNRLLKKSFQNVLPFRFSG